MINWDEWNEVNEEKAEYQEDYEKDQEVDSVMLMQARVDVQTYSKTDVLPTHAHAGQVFTESRWLAAHV